MAPTSYEVRDSVLVEVFFLLLISVFLGELPGCRRPSGSFSGAQQGWKPILGRGGYWKEFVGIWEELAGRIGVLARWGQGC